MCYERQSAGKDTACAEACPVQATICGDRDALTAEARKRLAAKPSDYYQRIYGLEEVGGTSVLILSAVPFEQIGLKTNLPHSPLPPLTMNVLGLIPNIVSAGGVLLGGIFWLTHRKNEVAKAENGNGNGRKH
jgi:formate dehydrogenase iron-sulfur subunit